MVVSFDRDRPRGDHALGPSPSATHGTDWVDDDRFERAHICASGDKLDLFSVQVVAYRGIVLYLSVDGHRNREQLGCPYHDDSRVRSVVPEWRIAFGVNAHPAFRTVSLYGEPVLCDVGEVASKRPLSEEHCSFDPRPTAYHSAA